MDVANPNPTSYTILDKITLKGLDVTDYNFIGWYLDSSYEKPISVIENRTRNLDLYAKFEAVNYTINYYDGDILIKTESLLEGTTISLPDYNKTGFNVVGFFTKDGLEIKDGSKVTGNLDLYVKLETITYTINYHNTTDSQNSNPSSYTILDTNKLNGLNKPNYEFIGQYLDSSYERPISVVENMTGNFDLYAKFKHLITPTLNGFSYIDGLC